MIDGGVVTSSFDLKLGEGVKGRWMDGWKMGRMMGMDGKINAAGDKNKGDSEAEKRGVGF